MNPLIAIPKSVEATGDRGVFRVASASRKGTWHRVDLEAMACTCERAEKGLTKQAALRNGELRWEELCRHLKLAAAAHGLIEAARYYQPEATRGA